MKKTILAVALLLVAIITQAQNSLFTNISTTDQYQEYWTVYDENGDGVYTVTDKRFPVSFQTEYLATGEGYKIEVVIEEEGNNKGNVQHRYNAIDNYYLASGYPYETILKHKYKKDGFVSIGDYVILLAGISDDNTSFEGIDKIYIKEGAGTASKTTEGEEEPKKKKKSFLDKVKAKANNVSSGYKVIKIEDLNVMITDYLVAMKAKQDARTSAELKGDKNIIAARDRGEADLKKYNDSIKATPEYKRTMAFHKKRAGEKVTIRNETGRIIYVFEKGDDRTFSGTELWDNGSTDKECDGDYSYSFSKKGSGTQCYTANTACGSQVIVN
ncbi:hypothetical protein [Lacinutrix sp. MEBiC02404]